MQKHTKYKILVIEDNIGDYTIIDLLLNEQFTNPIIERADTLKKATTVLLDAVNNFEVILLDLSLPDKQGDDLINEMLKLANNCPIVILTGTNNEEFSINSINKGISDYLIKDELSGTMLYKSIIYAIERKKSIIQLAESEKKYSELFQLSPQPMCLYQTNDFKISYINQAAINHFGYSKEEFLSMTVLDFVPKAHAHEILDVIASQNRQLNNTYTYEFKSFKKSGEIIDLQTYSTPLIINQQESTLIIIIDVTEQNLQEEKITRAIIQAQENERYVIGSEIHDNVSQILFAAQIAFKMLKKNLKEEDIIWHEQGSKHIQNATQEIRNLSHRLAPVFFEDSTLEEVINSLITSIDLENKFEITVDFSEDFKHFPCNQECQLTLYRILQEQFANIVKHANATAIKVRGFINSNALIMTVEDNGIGFDIKNVKSGLGLANIKRRTEVHLGKLTIDTSVGKGCILTVEMPLQHIRLNN
jgi:PAS domain S-box-containing protein